MVKRFRGFWLFNIKARSSKSALIKSRQKAIHFGLIVSAVRLVKKKSYPKKGIKIYSAFGGTKGRR